MRVLITGANGFVGGNVSRYLMARGIACVALDVKGVPEQGVYAARYTWDDLDTLDLSSFDGVIHLAGKAHDTKNVSDPQSYFDINVGLTRRVLEKCANAGMRECANGGETPRQGEAVPKQCAHSSIRALKFIFFSSVKACADTVEGVLTEECVPNPQTPYGRSKLEAEGLVRECGNAGMRECANGATADQAIREFEHSSIRALSCYILRPAMIQGPGNKGNMELLINVVQKGIPWPLGAFENKRSFASIENVSRVVEALLTKDVEPGIYQVADDEPLSTNQLIEQIAESLGRKPRIWKLPRGLMRGVARVGDLLHLPLNSERLKKLTESYVVSNAKLLRALGWETLLLPQSGSNGVVKSNAFQADIGAKKRIVLSLGRLHPLKGLDLLISAFAEIKRSSLVHECVSALGEKPDGRDHITNELMNSRTNELLPWQLVIAGPDEQGTKGKLKEISEKLKIRTADASDLSDASDADIVFMGAVQGEEKWDLIKKADIFVLPSRSENFGIVVGEALSCGVPVVTTAVGPWGGGEREKLKGKSEKLGEETPRQGEAAPGLIVVETSVEGIAQGLQQMMALSDEERHAMGQQGCEWVKREFSWERVAKQMVEAYGEGRAAARPCRGGINEPRG